MRLGSRVSSAIGAAASKPMNARMPYTDPAMIPDIPLNPGTVAKCVVNTSKVLRDPALTISVSASAIMTRISNAPRMSPNRELTWTPK